MAASFIEDIRQDLNKLKTAAVDKINEDGVQVWVKTDLGPEIKVFDSDAPKSIDNQGNETSNNILINYGVKIKNRQGRVLTKYNDYPQTNF